MTSPDQSTTNEFTLPDPTQFHFLSYFQSFMDTFDGPEINTSAIAPLIFELETKFQKALSYVESLPGQDISLEAQRSKLNELLLQLEQRCQSFQQYQKLLADRLNLIAPMDVEMQPRRE